MLLVGQVLVAWFAVTGFEKALEPQLSHKAGAVGRAIANQLEFVVDDLGIPPDELVGVDPFLDGILASNADIEYLIVLDDSSKVLFARGLTPATLERVLAGLPAADSETGFTSEIADFINSAFPIVVDGRVATVLHVGVSGEYVRGRLSELMYEVATIIVVSLLVTLEFLLFLMSVRVSGPMERVETILSEGARGMFGSRFAMRTRDEIGAVVVALNRALQSLRQRYEDFRFEAREIKDAQIDRNIAHRIQAASQQIDDRYRFSGGAELRLRNAMQIRIPLFVFMFAEELPRSFLPQFAARLSPPDATISQELLFGLPITLFMLAGMIMVPFAGGLTDRFGTRRVFLAGILPAMIGYFGTFLAQGYIDLIAWRVLSGIGYGLIFIAAQAWVADNTEMRDRAQGMAVFVGAGVRGRHLRTVHRGHPRRPSRLRDDVSDFRDPRGGLGNPRLRHAGRDHKTGNGARDCVWWQGAASAALRQAPVRRYRLRGDTGQADSDGLPVLPRAAVSERARVPAFRDRMDDHPLRGIDPCLCVLRGPIRRPFRASCRRRRGRRCAGRPRMPRKPVRQRGRGRVQRSAHRDTRLGFGHALSLASEIAIVQNIARRRGGLHQASIISAYRLAERGGMVLGPIVAGMLAARFGYQGAIVGIGVVLLVSIALYMIAVNPLRPESSVRRRTA